MRRSTKLLAALAAVCLGTAGAATGYLTIEHARIVSSTIDSSVIGASTPGSAAFTSASANTAQMNQSLAIGTAYSQFQVSAGTSAAPLRRGLTWGADPAGDVTLWLNSTETNPILRLLDGNSGTQYFSAGPNGITSANGATITGTTYTNSVSATGTGNFGGAVTAAGFNGNASSATALAAAPTSCPYVANGAGNYYEPALGIGANGNAICGPLHQSAILTSGCTTASGTNSSCTNTVPWPVAFADTNYTVVCQGGGPSDPARTALNMQQRQTTGIVVNTENTGNEAVSFATIHCIAEHF